MSPKKRFLSPLKSNNDMSQTKKQKLFPELDESIAHCFDDDESFIFDITDKQNDESPKLNLSTWQRCIVEQIERVPRTYELILHVSSDTGQNKENSKDSGTVGTKCHLQGPWAHTQISVGDVLSLQGAWDNQINAFKVDQDQGFCVTNADVLLAGTTVVGSLFCRRKAVLQDRFRGIDANSKVMIIGSLVHELLQLALSKGLSSVKEIDTAAYDLLETQDSAYMLYGSMLTREEVVSEVQKFVPNIVSFVQQYVKGRLKDQTPIQVDNFQGTITEIADIEENLWVPQLGLKGKIDVSVRINRSRANKSTLSTSKHAIPLELKTGRATFSMEHKGQLILYQMMLNAIGRDISSSGLLLYLREGILREILAGRNEQRDLIILRNDLAYYLTKFVSSLPLDENIKLHDDKFFQPFELPEPISHHSACFNCAYATICCSFAKTDPNLQLRSDHPLNKVMQQSLSHLQSADYEYFMHWCLLLVLEEKDERSSNFQRSLWTEPSEVRQKQGRAILGLRLQGDVISEEMRFVHTMILDRHDDEVDFTLSGFSVGEYVIVSSKQRLAIAAGFLQTLTTSCLSVSLERDLRQNYSGEIFIIDKHESQAVKTFNYTNLGILLDDTERSAALREIVIQRKAPSYVKTLSKIVTREGEEILRALNSIQRAALLKALTTESFMLIKGLPGTGKTQTLVAIVQLLHLLGKSVIITSHTHSAVDNLLLRLKKCDLPMLRLGNIARIHPDLKDCAESIIMENCKTEQELSQKYDTFKIIGVTCLGSSHSIFLHRRFDYCIVDEATQVMQPTVLRPLFYCKKFILVGDPDQLPPLIRSKEGRKRGADESLFLRLDSTEATSILSQQYRMNKTITKFANALTYGGTLKCGSKEVEMASLDANLTNHIKSYEKWVQRALQSHVDQAVFVLDTLECATRSLEFASSKHSIQCAAIEEKYFEKTIESPQQKPSNGNKRLSKYTNYCDAAIIFHVLKVLLTFGYDATRIGIIAPYRAQVELLKKLTLQYHDHQPNKDLKLNFAAVEVNTVDQYQGRDKDIIIYSGCKTGQRGTDNMERPHEAEILEDKRRLTVAITRAKKKLLLVADANCLMQYTPFQALLSRIPGFCQLRLEDGKFGFNWNELFDELAQVIAL